MGFGVVADPGFPVGGVDPLGGHRTPMWAVFVENVCENERIGSRRGGCRAPGTAPVDCAIKMYSPCQIAPVSMLQHSGRY